MPPQKTVASQGEGKAEDKHEAPDPSDYPLPKDLDPEPEPWVPIFFAKHWSQGGSVPTEPVSCGGTIIEIVKEEALPVATLHPIMVKEEYPVILKKLEDQLDNKAHGPKRMKLNKDGIKSYSRKDCGDPVESSSSRGLCVFGHTGSGASFAIATTTRSLLTLAGKSTSLVYLLIAMLRRKQPVLYVYDSVDQAIIFTEKFCGVVSKKYVARLGTHTSPLVILYDAMANEIPTEWYGAMRPNLHLVLATSPSISRFRHWIKSGVHCLTVEPFSKAEVTCLS
jgi:hypothetical protein